MPLMKATTNCIAKSIDKISHFFGKMVNEGHQCLLHIINETLRKSSITKNGIRSKRSIDERLVMAHRKLYQKGA